MPTDEDICALVLKYNLPVSLLKAISINLLQLISDDICERGKGRMAVRKYLAEHNTHDIYVERSKHIAIYNSRKYLDTNFYRRIGCRMQRIVSVSDIIAFLD